MGPSGRARWLAVRAIGIAMMWWAVVAPSQTPTGTFPGDMTGRIMTVLGPINASELGTTLMHEHLFIDQTLPLDRPDRWQLAGRRFPVTAEDLRVWDMPVTDPADRSFLMRHAWENRDMLRLQDVEESLAEAMQFKAVGGSAIVDVTSIGIGRDPEKLVEIARRSGLHVVMGAGWYRSVWHPAGHATRTVESLTEEIVRDVTVGVGDSGVRAGIIGEVAAMDVVTEPKDSAEAKGVRAAARASRMTGAVMSIHQWYRDGTNLRRTLDLIEEEGGDLSRVIVGHVDGVTSRDLGKLRHLLDRGVTLEFDLLGIPFRLNVPVMDERPMVDAVVSLIREGYGDRLLLSQDVCTKFQQTRYGGNGLTYVAIEVVPYLRLQGITDQQIHGLLVDNPRRLLAFAPRLAPAHLGRGEQADD